MAASTKPATRQRRGAAPYPARPGAGSELVADAARATARDDRLRTWLSRRATGSSGTGLLLSLALLLVVGGGLALGLPAFLVRGNDAVLDLALGWAWSPS